MGADTYDSGGRGWHAGGVALLGGAARAGLGEAKGRRVLGGRAAAAVARRVARRVPRIPRVVLRALSSRV